MMKKLMICWSSALIVGCGGAQAPDSGGRLYLTSGDHLIVLKRQ